MQESERVLALFQNLLGRNPTTEELSFWTDKLKEHQDFFLLFKIFTNTKEYLERGRVKTAWPPGHFYSPVVDPDTVRRYVDDARRQEHSEIYGIDLNLGEMERFWRDNQAFIGATPFTREPSSLRRYYWHDSPYPIGDATTYRAVINSARPKRVIEIGSGFSSACALDTIDEIDLDLKRFICIDPFPAALIKRLRAEDSQRLFVVESGVQNVPVSIFEELERNDILFIDSTHVLKTGSDVHYELFSILPSLKPGVLVHFHDVRWPFEYPSEFIFERNFSWNEAYAVRALLMYSTRFSVKFYNSLFAKECTHLVRETFRDFLINPGSSIWLTVND